MVSAQEAETLFSRGGLGLSGIWYQRTFNFSSYDTDWAYLRGGAIGLEFGRDVFLGWGRYRIQHDVPLASGDNTINTTGTANVTLGGSVSGASW